MKKLLALTTILTVIGASSAFADSLFIGIGQPQPTYIAPPPAYIVEPEPVPYHTYYEAPRHRDRHHYYDWRYWHHDNGMHGNPHDRDHDDDRHDGPLQALPQNK